MSDDAIRVVIADDEPLAREGLRMRLEREPDIVIVAEAKDGDEAISAIVEHMPDVVFLDVHMPGATGFEVLEALPGELMPLVVFVTAFDRYAIDAFEVHAVDYVLKPFDEPRFQTMLQRVRSLHAHGSRDESRRHVAELMEERISAHTGGAWLARSGTVGHVQRFVVKGKDGYHLLRADDVDLIESAGNYVRLHTATGVTYLLRASMGELERDLDPNKFTRIHRSTIVNIDRIVEFRPAAHGDFHVLLANGQKVRMSRHYRDRLLSWRRSSGE